MQQFYRVVKAPRPPHLSFPGLTLPSPRFYFVSLPRASSKNKAMIAARSWFCKEPRRTARLLCKAGSSRAVGRNPPSVLWRETKEKHRPEAIGFVFLFTNHLGAGRHQLPGPLKQSSRLPFSSQPGERSQACSTSPFVLSLQRETQAMQQRALLSPGMGTAEKGPQAEKAEPQHNREHEGTDPAEEWPSQGDPTDPRGKGDAQTAI